MISRNETLGAELVKDMPVAAAAGYGRTKLMEPISPKLYEWEPKKEREREYEVGPGRR